ncbi:hypothetical protein PtA15_7A722 [Puccinia triticina]|uniref:RGS domain-containing protein n=1 Tax=Puccinia triticina TaxID=208348 RepID=A0ABY7CP16_9BASI|nr:uncharacterized protein PtA15_7A722 [Puccinia triticina]WAQ86993.1 hypothetical protein PtA15_7A722 [Puccinia triticina]
MTDQTPREHQAENSEPSLSQSELEKKSERLHIHDDDRKDFTSFCQRAGLPTAFGYLNLLEHLFEILNAGRNDRLTLINFATGRTIQPWRNTVFLWMAEDDQLRQDKLMQLALMRRYPQLYDSEKIDTAAKIRALESPLVVGETILRSIIEPPILALDVVQKGFNSEYVGHDEIVTPTIEALETPRKIRSSRAIERMERAPKVHSLGFLLKRSVQTWRASRCERFAERFM